MQPESEAQGLTGFRSFLLLIAVIIVAFIGWLIWAAISFSPTAEKDIAKSLIGSPLFNRDFSIVNQPSTCGSNLEVKGQIPAALIEKYREVNQLETPAQLDLHRFRKEKRILGNSKSAQNWYLELKTPVMNVSNVGVLDSQALVCLELHASQGHGMFAVLEHSGADYWRIVQTETTWQVKREVPEEIPELQIPSF